MGDGNYRYLINDGELNQPQTSRQDEFNNEPASHAVCNLTACITSQPLVSVTYSQPSSCEVTTSTCLSIPLTATSSETMDNGLVLTSVTAVPIMHTTACHKSPPTDFIPVNRPLTFGTTPTTTNSDQVVVKTSLAPRCDEIQFQIPNSQWNPQASHRSPHVITTTQYHNNIEHQEAEPRRTSQCFGAPTAPKRPFQCLTPLFTDEAYHYLRRQPQPPRNLIQTPDEVLSIPALFHGRQDNQQQNSGPQILLAGQSHHPQPIIPHQLFPVNEPINNDRYTIIHRNKHNQISYTSMSLVMNDENTPT
jgi:hypothetical protein